MPKRTVHAGALYVAIVIATASFAAEDATWWTLEDGRFTNTLVGYSMTVPSQWTMKPDSPPDSVSFLHLGAGAFFTIRRFEAANRLDALALSLLGGAKTVLGDKLGPKPIDVKPKTVAGVAAQETVWRYDEPGNPGIVRDVCVDRDPADTVLLDIIFVLPKSAKRKLDADVERVLTSLAFEARREAT